MFLLITSHTVLNAQKREDYSLKGKVTSITEDHYYPSYDLTNTGLIKNIDYKTEQKRWDFDINGNCILDKRLLFDANKHKIHQKREYTYDSYGRVLFSDHINGADNNGFQSTSNYIYSDSKNSGTYKRNTFYYSSGDASTTNKTNLKCYEYDRNSKILKIYDGTNQNLLTLFNYNQLNDYYYDEDLDKYILSTKQYFEKGILQYMYSYDETNTKTTYTYNKSGKLTKEETKDLKSSGKILNKVEYTYNSNNEIVKKIETDYIDKEITTTEYRNKKEVHLVSVDFNKHTTFEYNKTWNNKGDLLSDLSIFENGSYEKRDFSYEYDSKGNWIVKKVELTKSGDDKHTFNVYIRHIMYEDGYNSDTYLNSILSKYTVKNSSTPTVYPIVNLIYPNYGSSTFEPSQWENPRSTEYYLATCYMCHGTGNCSTCNGTHYYNYPFGSGQLECPNCNKDGKCRTCNGSGKVQKMRVK